VRSTKPRGDISAADRKAARATVEETQRRLRAATSQRERDMLEGILDRAKRSLAAATKDMRKPAPVSLDLITSEFREALEAVVVEENE
jgi:uncharacterized membrane protein YccC